jgi:hypothetical protein
MVPMANIQRIAVVGLLLLAGCGGPSGPQASSATH